MRPNISSFRQLFVGKVVAITFSILLAGSLLISGSFVPGYLAVLFASGVRNIYLSWLGSGILFYAVAFVFLYLEAVVLTTVYFGLEYVYTNLHKVSKRNPPA